MVIAILNGDCTGDIADDAAGVIAGRGNVAIVSAILDNSFSGSIAAGNIADDAADVLRTGNGGLVHAIFHRTGSTVVHSAHNTGDTIGAIGIS